jgi:hypothetical protein
MVRGVQFEPRSLWPTPKQPAALDYDAATVNNHAAAFDHAATVDYDSAAVNDHAATINNHAATVNQFCAGSQ